MKINFTFLVSIGLLFSTVLLGQSSQPIKRLDESFIKQDSLEARIRFLLKEANVSGLAISIFNENKPIYSKTFGLASVPEKKPLSPNTVLYGASFSKAIFAYLVMQLVEEKVIDLDKPLVQYLKKPLVDYKIEGYKRGYKDLVNDKRVEKITARMCLNHTTGFPNWRWFEQDKKIKIKFEPGTRYSYSGEGLFLLQFVITQILGKDYETLAGERVFKPLQMQNTSHLWQPRFENNFSYGHDAKGNHYKFMKWDEAVAAGSMSTTLEDYTKFFTTLMQKKGLKESGYQEMFKPQVRIKSKAQFGPDSWVDDDGNDPIHLSYGLGFGLMKTPSGKAFFKEGHDDGWGHYSIGFPEKGIAVILMTNNDNGESIFKELLELTIKDTFTPWKWENYIPYNMVSK